MVYDALLLFGVLALASFPYVLIAAGRPGPMARLGFQLYLLALCLLFFSWSWVRGGQTLGMRAWRLRLVRADGGPVTWTLAVCRFAAALLSLACLGIGFLWILVDRDRLAWHDRLSATRLILEPPAPRDARRTHPARRNK